MTDSSTEQSLLQEDEEAHQIIKVDTSFSTLDQLRNQTQDDSLENLIVSNDYL